MANSRIVPGPPTVNHVVGAIVSVIRPIRAWKSAWPPPAGDAPKGAVEPEPLANPFNGLVAGIWASDVGSSCPPAARTALTPTGAGVVCTANPDWAGLMRE